MLTVTSGARLYIEELLERNPHVTEGSLMRLTPRDESLATFELKPDRKRPNDEIVDCDGEATLLIDKKVAPLLEDRVMDTTSTDRGQRLVIDFEPPKS